MSDPADRVNGAALPGDPRGDVLREQMRLAIGQIPPMQGTSFLVAVVLAAVYWNLVPHAQVVAWVLMITAVAVSRYFLYVWFHAAGHGFFDGESWRRRYEVSTLVSGILWGMSAILLFPPGDQVMQSLLLLVMTTLAATTTVSHSSIKSAPLLWTVPAILPFAVRGLMDGGLFGYAIGTLLPLFILTLGFYSFRLNRTIASSITLHFKNLALVEDLRQATRLKDQFVSLVSHDLRGPIAGIKSTADFTRQMLREGDGAEKADGLVVSISELAAALLDLLDQLLDISRLQTGKITPINRTFFVRQLAAERMLMAAPAAEQKNIAIRNELPEDARVLADRALYGQVIGNLLSNAIKFSRPGGVIRIYAPAAEGAFAVAIEDRGIGIPPGVVGDIFRHEVKTSTVGTGGERGTGLGLPFCMDIMKAHGGAIEADSRPGEGSTFIIRLPLTGRTALVVDDLEAHRAIFKRALAKVGDVTVAEAENGRDALEELRRSTPNLIITDIEMPEMNGIALLSAVRGDPRFRDIPVVVVTSNRGAGREAVQKLREELLAIGASDFLEKPVIEEEFIRCVRRFL
ncbi:MAG: response regulator [Nitrospinae bacterium]|nr:response regulator [Nitrospinota bacterium]